jgi:hypothetical protein
VSRWTLRCRFLPCQRASDRSGRRGGPIGLGTVPHDPPQGIQDGVFHRSLHSVAGADQRSGLVVVRGGVTEHREGVYIPRGQATLFGEIGGSRSQICCAASDSSVAGVMLACVGSGSFLLMRSSRPPRKTLRWLGVRGGATGRSPMKLFAGDGQAQKCELMCQAKKRLARGYGWHPVKMQTYPCLRRCAFARRRGVSN